jgi:hypothetical protein
MWKASQETLVLDAHLEAIMAAVDFLGAFEAYNEHWDTHQK